MSIADLKVRLADVPGIEILSMALEAGRIMLRWGTSYSASVDASASDSDIEAAIRNAIKLPGVPLTQDKPAIATLATNGVSSMSSNPASAGASVKALMEDHVRMMGDIHQAQLRILESSLARQRETVAGAVGKVAEKIDGQTEDFLAIMGQFANDLGYAMARPSDYSPELTAVICARMAEGVSLRSICLADDMPDKATVFRGWRLTESSATSARARGRLGRTLWRKKSLKFQTTTTTTRLPIRRAAPRAQQRIRRALAAQGRYPQMADGRMAPKVYGDKVTQEPQGSDGGPVSTITKIELVAAPIPEGMGEG